MNPIERLGYALIEHSSIPFKDFMIFFLLIFFAGFLFFFGYGVAENVRDWYRARQKEKLRRAMRARRGINR